MQPARQLIRIVRCNGMADAEIKAGVTRLLESWRFAVTPIPESASKSPDLLAEKDGASFVFELKERLDDPVLLAEERAKLEAGEVVSRAVPAGRTNRVSGIVKHGVGQLSSYQAPAGAFYLLWLHASGKDAELQIEQFRGTLYGMTNIFDLDAQHSIRCYYFHHSDFYRWRHVLVGAIVSTFDHLQLCLNTASPRTGEFRGSPLVRQLASGLLDPTKLEREGSAYIADCDVDRNKEGVALQYIQKKYGRPKLMDLNMSKFSARVLVPKVDGKDSGSAPAEKAKEL